MASRRPSHVAARVRPALFRALGHAEPPADVVLQNESFQREEVLKHDSWAATGIYRSATGRRAICKFNRSQPIGWIPMRWLGRVLARRERRCMARLEGVPGVPPDLGPVRVAGQILPHAVSRTYVAGHALAEGERVNDEFFPRLAETLAAVHARRMAHVDLHKRENIIVDDAGGPLLIDFQISFAAPEGRLGRILCGGLLRVLQRCDDYHLLKHRLKHRPDQVGCGPAEIERLRPAWIRAHRWIAVPFRACRRRFLAVSGIRGRCGMASSEAFPEIAHRPAHAA